MPVYQRKGSPFYWMSISVPGRPRFRGSTGKTTEKEARRVELDKERELTKAAPKVEVWRVRDCFGAYWSDHGQHKDTEDDIFRSLEILRAHLGADTLITAITNAQVMDYRAKRRGGLIEVEDMDLRPVGPSTVNRDLAYLKAALTHAQVMHGKTVPALAWKQLKLKEPEHRVRFAGATEFARLMKCAHETVKEIIIGAVTTGLRKANLQWDWHQVDLGSASITVPRSKGKKPMIIRITPPLAAVLGRTPPSERKGPVFDWTNFRKRWDAAVKDAGLVDFHFHDLRHTFASWARQAGADLADICEAMYHSTVAVTMRYAHIKPDNRDTAFDRVADMLQPRKTRRASQSVAQRGKK